MIFAVRTLGLVALGGVGVGAAQLPAFVQQYLQRLGGHLDEARLLAARLADGQSFIDLEPAARAAMAAATEARVAELSAAHEAIINADDLTRPLVFLTHVDGAIAAATWRVFEPGLPLGVGGALYGFAAAAVAYLTYAGCRGVLTRRRSAKLVAAEK